MLETTSVTKVFISEPDEFRNKCLTVRIIDGVVNEVRFKSENNYHRDDIPIEIIEYAIQKPEFFNRLMDEIRAEISPD